MRVLGDLGLSAWGIRCACLGIQVRALGDLGASARDLGVGAWGFRRECLGI